LESGIDFLELLVANKILMSKGEVRRAIKNNGIKINDQLINSEKKVLGLEDFENETMKLSFGKKKHYIFKII
jgi:tyrosyl-tRNA synthetase